MKLSIEFMNKKIILKTNFKDGFYIDHRTMNAVWSMIYGTLNNEPQQAGVAKK